MFEEDHPQSPTEPVAKKRVGMAVMLAAGGVVVATLFATVASMLAASGQEVLPERTSADIVQTITSVAPDGSTSTVVVTVALGATASSAKPDRKQAARPQEQPRSPARRRGLELSQTNPAPPTQTNSNPPASPPAPSSSSSSSAASSSTAPPSSSSSSSSAEPAPKP